MIKIKYSIFLAIIALFLGFFVGLHVGGKKSSVETKETIKYIRSGYIIHDTIYEPQPYEIIKNDTLYVSSDVVVDTLKILEDYFLRRKYDLDFSNDSTGTFKVDAEVYMNRIVQASSTIQPIVKTVVVEKEVKSDDKKLHWYSTIGTSVDMNTNIIGIGISVKQKYLLGVSGIRADNKYNFMINMGFIW
jgi:hypothetical protein